MLLSDEIMGIIRTCNDVAAAQARREVLKTVAVPNPQVMMRSIFTVVDGVTAAMRTRESEIHFDGARVRRLTDGSLVNVLKAERKSQTHHIDH
jgi:hypothetical protein